jgi:hypothetical protein
MFVKNVLLEHTLMVVQLYVLNVQLERTQVMMGVKYVKNVLLEDIQQQ